MLRRPQALERSAEKSEVEKEFLRAICIEMEQGHKDKIGHGEQVGAEKWVMGRTLTRAALQGTGQRGARKEVEEGRSKREQRKCLRDLFFLVLKALLFVRKSWIQSNPTPLAL